MISKKYYQELLSDTALEIKRLCLLQIGQELPESTLVEMEALFRKEQLPSEKQEAITLTC